MHISIRKQYAVFASQKEENEYATENCDEEGPDSNEAARVVSEQADRKRKEVLNMLWYNISHLILASMSKQVTRTISLRGDSEPQVIHEYRYQN